MNAADSPAASEAQRYERLRAQDGKPLVPPPSLHELLGPEGLDPAKIDQAHRLWQQAAAELGVAPSFPTEERLYWCFFLLSSRLSMQGDRAAARTVAESTLPLLREPRHQQLALGSLGRSAALLGDHQTAQSALSQLLPTSDDLLIDTNYRFSTAYVAAMQGDDAAVLTCLGMRVADVPIADGYDKICAVLRANALERQGQGQLAIDQLLPIAATKTGMQDIVEIVQLNASLGLLSQTLTPLRQQGEALAARTVRTGSGISVASIVVPLLGAPLIVGATLALEGLDRHYRGTAQPVVAVVLLLLVSVLVFRALTAGSRLRKRLAKNGVDAAARILSVDPTSTRVNGQPLVRLRLLVQVGDRAPYQAVHGEVIGRGKLAKLSIGMQLRARVDPADPRRMALNL